MNKYPKKPRRLDQIFQSYDAPIYFITFCTADRKCILANPSVHKKLIEFAKTSELRGVAIGRYVIMPDHIHLFIRLTPDKKLGTTMRLLKRALSSGVESPMPHWQPGFFDRLLRHGESYAAKWNYIYQNPMRAGLVGNPEQWTFQGEWINIQY